MKFNDLIFLTNNFRVIATISDEKSLYYMYEKIRDKRSFSVARRLLLKNRSFDKTWVFLNKQAAFVGNISLCEEEAESPLGPIKLSINSHNLDRVIDWLTQGW